MNTTPATDLPSTPVAPVGLEPHHHGDRWAAAKQAKLDALVAVLAQGGHGVMMMAGTAGVGKTTIAAAVAVILAGRGLNVHLVLTAPSAELAASLEGKVAHLTLAKIDPVAETAAYRDEVLRVQGAALSQAGRAMLEEDLLARSTVETAIFRAFAREAEAGAEGFVVLDSSPTAHTLLLLDASAAYQRELERQEPKSAQPENVQRLLARLRDPAFARVLVVTVPSGPQVAEAAGVQEDLRRAHVEPYAWIFDQTQADGTGENLGKSQTQTDEQCALCAAVDGHTLRTAWVARQPQSPVGPAALLNLATAPFSARPL